MHACMQGWLAGWLDVYFYVCVHFYDYVYIFHQPEVLQLYDQPPPPRPPPPTS